MTVVGRRGTVLEETTNELGPASDSIVGDRGMPQTIVDAIIAKHGRLDILVNNAGVATVAPLAETSDEEIERMYRTNVFATLALSRAALPHLIKTGGSIINISSIAAGNTTAGQTAYGSSKAAVDHITRSLAVEYGPSGVRVNAIAPGMTTTEMTEAARSDERTRAAVERFTPLRRFGEPVDIARAVLLLASDDAGWITGQIVKASGGLSV